MGAGVANRAPLTLRSFPRRRNDRFKSAFSGDYNNRAALGVNDEMRAERALLGVKGKRLTDQTTGGKRAAEARAS